MMNRVMRAILINAFFFVLIFLYSLLILGLFAYPAQFSTAHFDYLD